MKKALFTALLAAAVFHVVTAFAPTKAQAGGYVVAYGSDCCTYDPNAITDDAECDDLPVCQQ